MAYQLTSTHMVIRLADGAFIPDDPLNIDRQAYEQWVAQGGVPQEMDPPHTPSVQSQIDALERENMLPKATRKFMLSFMEATAIQQGASQGLNATQALALLAAGNPGYAAVKALDDQIEALEALL